MQVNFSNKVSAELLSQLQRILPASSIKVSLLDRLSFASDAGFYQLIPMAVLQPATEAELQEIFKLSHQHQVPVVFRTGGTSLSGQAITDGLLIDLALYWRKAEVQQEGNAIVVQPGVIGAIANHILKPYHRKIGPDPASINSAMMGGIISNNASSMCCGVAQNSYHTIRHIRFMLTNGLIFDTRKEGEALRFEQNCPELAEQLRSLRAQILQSPDLLNKIRKKYKQKNTVGYALNALVDYETPLLIFAHLLVGAEGTLAFISEAVLETVTDYPIKATGLLFFSDIYAACSAIEGFSQAGAKAIELMDRSALRSVEHVPGIPTIIKELPEAAAALLVEFQGVHNSEVDQQLASLKNLIPQLSLLAAPAFSQEPLIQELYWKVRKGMFPSVGAVRARGTTIILEDVAVPVPNLGNAIKDLQDLFIKYNYDNAIIFGHARDGNIHFVVTQAFDTDAEIQRYDQFIREVVSLIVGKYDGALKAEHGTGRNMAPFVETEWGGELYQIMKTIKQLADPQNLLNPGVIINNQSDAHIQFLKEMPQVEGEVDACIECGFCEHKCPSRDYTMTPRRRIVARRAMQSLDKRGETGLKKELLQQYQFNGLDTCAVDGLCATACPVDIDTGKLVKRLRAENHSGFSNKIALFTAKNFGFTASIVKTALQAGGFINSVFGKRAMFKLTSGLRKIAPTFPLWSSLLKAAGSWKKIQKQHSDQTKDNTVVYFPACINRTMGNADGGASVLEHFSSVAQKTGLSLYIPTDAGSSCCGQIYSSKGFTSAYDYTANKMVERLWDWTKEGRYPVVIDFSSCVYTLLQSGKFLTSGNQQKLKQITIWETIQFIQERVLPAISKVQKKDKVVLHPVCSLEKMGIKGVLANVARHFAEEVIMPHQAGCCGMAGDRGFLIPELTASACSAEAAEVKAAGEASGYYSTSKTCEMALTDAVGKNYHTIMRLVDETIA